MKVINLTPHKVVVYAEDKQTILAEIEPQPSPLRMVEEDLHVGEILGVPLLCRTFKLPSALPDEFNDPNCVVIVSLPLLMMLKIAGVDVSAVVVAPDTGSGAVRDSEGKIIGTTRFITL